MVDAVLVGRRFEWRKRLTLRIAEESQTVCSDQLRMKFLMVTWKMINFAWFVDPTNIDNVEVKLPSAAKSATGDLARWSCLRKPNFDWLLRYCHPVHSA
jgi:hypothetical protein